MNRHAGPASSLAAEAAQRGGSGIGRWWPILVLPLLMVVPLVHPAVPPLTDLPAHMSRVMIQMDAGRSADIARWYSFEWKPIPNLGTDLVAWVLEPHLGLQITMKAIAMLIVVLQAAGYLLLSRAAHGRVQVPALFALPLAYGNPFHYGFLNYTLAAALATLALALWISPRMAARPVLRWLAFCPIACAVWISHLAGWALLCLMVGCCELAARLEKEPRLTRALAGGFMASSCLLLPQLLSMLWPDASGHPPSAGFFYLAEKFYFIANVLADRWAPFDYLCALLLIVVILLTWRTRLFVRHRGLALSTVVLFAVFWLLPAGIYGSFYDDMRLVPTIFALAIIAVRPTVQAGQMRWMMVAALAFLGVRIAATTASMALWDRQIRQEAEVLAALPRGSQLVTFSALPCRPFVLQVRIRDTHLASYALLERHAFANDQFALAGGQLLQVHNPAAGEFERDPSGTEIGEPCKGSFPLMDSAAKIPAVIPHMWIVWHTPERPVPGWSVMARSGASVLYRRGR